VKVVFHKAPSVGISYTVDKYIVEIQEVPVISFFAKDILVVISPVVDVVKLALFNGWFHGFSFEI
jgi:hypothetical protein